MQESTPPKKSAHPVLRWLQSTSKRTFVLYPVLIVVFQYLWTGGHIAFQPLGLILLAWGYLQYRLAGQYRTRLGGGGPGIEVPPDRIVDTGIYAYTRNPMYLGHMIYMLGLAVTFWSWAALLLLAGHIVWFEGRARDDEERLRRRFGAPYADYQRRVKRWIPFVY
ncbi:MAG TPA: isoprenylcysteine carboxylmethyltransferase family protein [Xanthobacteraceae bacterium]|nr:isoprenylcysteine carboxylmethyltransferase family protein [Xanthobacteraceae bacterium]